MGECFALLEKKIKKIIFAMGYVVHHHSRSVFETSLLLVCVVRTQNIYFLQLISQDLNGEKFPLVVFGILKIL